MRSPIRRRCMTSDSPTRYGELLISCMRGTSFIRVSKKHGNQDLEIWLRSMLSSNVHFEFEEGEVFGKHVVVAKITPAAYQIARFKNEAYMRTGSSTQKLVPGSRRESELWAKVGRAAFETQVALEHLMLDEVVSLLDVPLYYEKLGEPMPAQSESALHALEVDRFVVKDGRFLCDYKLRSFNHCARCVGVSLRCQEGAAGDSLRWILSNSHAKKKRRFHLAMPSRSKMLFALSYGASAL